MRLSFLAVLALFFMNFPACANETEAAATRAAGLSDPLFRRAFTQCMTESAAMADREKMGDPDLTLIGGCLMDKGIDIKVTGEPPGPRAVRMGTGAGKQPLAEVMSYSIKDPDTLEKKLALPDDSGIIDTGAASRGAPPSENRERNAQSGVDKKERKTQPYSPGQLYVPSDRSGDGPKPIFLDR